VNPTSDLVSLVLPCRNQADHIARVLEGYAAALERMGQAFELIVVPNACTDQTPEVVEEIGRRDPRIRVVSLALGGWGRSVRAGLAIARGSVLSYTNTARTDPMTVPDFVRRYFATGAGLVKARREARHAPLREFGSMLYNLQAKLCFRVNCRDVNGTPKVFGRELYEAARLQSDGDLIDLELMRFVASQRLHVVEIPVRGFKRHGGKSSTTLTSAWHMYAGAFSMWLRGAA
jgi:glycosyltransferase involved in cell wall biosynthesis